MPERDTPNPADAGTLARAEAAAEREAAAEAAAEATRSGSKATSPKIVQPRVRTSAKADDAGGAVKTSRPVGAVKPARSGSAASSSGPSTADGSLAGALQVEPPRSVSGETVSVTKSGLQTVTATNIDVRQGGIGRARATDIAISQGGVGFARGDRVSVELGGVGAALAGELHVTQGAVGSVIARDVRIEQSGVRMLVANEVHAERTTGVMVLIARKVDGNVRTLLDWRGALAFGAAFGAIVSLFRARDRGGRGG
jgi:hypothetical protein